MKIKKGDPVQVIAGKDVGKEGEITRVIPETDRVIVDGVNVAKRHQRATNARRCRAASSTRTCRCTSRTWRSSARRATSTTRDRLPVRGRRHEGPGLPQVREGPVMATAALKERYSDRAAPGAPAASSGSAT